MDNMDDIEEDLQLLCEKYKDKYGILVVVQPDNKDSENEFGIFGNLCAVCAQVFLNHFIVDHKVTHETNVGSIH